MGDIRAEVAALMLVVLKQVLWNQFVFLPATVLLLFSPLMVDVFAVLSVCGLRLDG